MWSRVSGGAAAPPLFSCRFHHELATKTGFYQTVREEPERQRESRNKGSLTGGGERSDPREAQRFRKVKKQTNRRHTHREKFVCSALLTPSRRWHSTNTDHFRAGVCRRVFF